ncbi:MAG: hypothetical protein B7Z52_03970 [Burkholderiales bacterium 12-64-5]|nr:MAG: hypothetical protein B7Z52_03970 [Burkholderiales bacterium 12-64-5]
MQSIGKLSLIADVDGMEQFVRVKFDRELLKLNQQALDPFDGKTNKDELRKEHDREFGIFSSGRRDAYWALRSRIAKARRLIYLDGIGFGQTGYPADPLVASTGGLTPDLLEELGDRLDKANDLKVILCLSKFADYSDEYASWRDEEAYLRWKAVTKLRTDSRKDRVLVFHPLAMPGRPLSLLTNLTVIDDVWALIGTSSFRRRGLTYDGGCDVVLSDNDIEAAGSKRVAELRRMRVGGHLGLLPQSQSAWPPANWIRIQSMEGTFQAVSDLLRAGGGGLIEPLAEPRRYSFGITPSLIDPED